MTKLLEQAFEKASTLPEAKQDDFARRVLEELAADQKWDELFADSRSDTLLEQLSAEALLEIEQGETEDFDAAIDASHEIANH